MSHYSSTGENRQVSLFISMYDGPLKGNQCRKSYSFPALFKKLIISIDFPKGIYLKGQARVATQYPFQNSLTFH